MRLQIISDLHLEFFDDYERFVNGTISLVDAEKTVLVVAGDLCSASKEYIKRIEYAFDMWSYAYQCVVYVPGNHEYYGTEKHTVIKKNIRRAAKGKPTLRVKKNIHVLDNESVEINGARILGGTMWGDYIADQRHIPGLLAFPHLENDKFKQLLYRGGYDIAVTHHLPSMELVSPAYKNSSVNSYFVSERLSPCRDVIREATKPFLWICGHSHDPVDKVVGRTRVVSNPYGYHHEHSAMHWSPTGAILEVDVATKSITRLKE